MPGDSGGDRDSFAQRLRRQFEARYRGSSVELDDARFALRVRGPGIDTAVPLAALYAACQRQPARTAALVADFVRSIDARLSAPPAQDPLDRASVLWCVRSRDYLSRLARSDELLTEPLGADLVAFVAESLPGQVMRGVPRSAWEAATLDEAALRRAADAATEARFTATLERVRAIRRVPADGWRLAGDSLYQGSILKVPTILAAFAERAGGDVLIGVPDRAVALVVPAAQRGSEQFGRRVLQEWRESMNPCSHAVLRCDGRVLAAADRAHRSPSLLPWLHD